MGSGLGLDSLLGEAFGSVCGLTAWGAKPSGSGLGLDGLGEAFGLGSGIGGFGLEASGAVFGPVLGWGELLGSSLLRGSFLLPDPVIISLSFETVCFDFFSKL